MALVIRLVLLRPRVAADFHDPERVFDFFTSAAWKEALLHGRTQLLFIVIPIVIPIGLFVMEPCHW
jgi:hypothetical protein